MKGLTKLEASALIQDFAPRFGSKITPLIAVCLAVAACTNEGAVGGNDSSSFGDPPGERITTSTFSNKAVRMGSVVEHFEMKGEWIALHDSVARLHAAGRWRLSEADDGGANLCVEVNTSQIASVPALTEICRKVIALEGGKRMQMGFLLDSKRIVEFETESREGINK